VWAVQWAPHGRCWAQHSPFEAGFAQRGFGRCVHAGEPSLELRANGERRNLYDPLHSRLAGSA